MKSVCRSGTKSSRVCVAFSPRPVFSPEPMAIFGLVLLVARVGRVLAGMQERRQSLPLVALEDRRSNCRRDDEHAVTMTTNPAAIARKWLQRIPARNITARSRPRTPMRCRGLVAGIRVRRCKPEQQVAGGALARRAAPGPVDDKAVPGHRSKAPCPAPPLEIDEGKLECPPRAARGSAEDEDHPDADEHQRVDADPQLGKRE